jgi:hypothetical protein
MRHRMVVRVLIVMLCAARLCPPGNCSDCCQSVIPDALRSQLLKKYASCKPMSSEYTSAYYADQATASGRSCCYFATAGDFNGDHKTDYAVILKDNATWRLTLVAALSNEKGWLLQKLFAWDGEGDNPYVETLPPGEYRGIGTIDPTYRKKGQPDSIRSKTDGILSGSLESSGCAYFFQNDKWVHFWVSD